MPKSLDLIYARVKEEINVGSMILHLSEISTQEIGNWDIDEENKCNRKDLIHLLIRDGFLVTEKEEPIQHYLILELTKIL